MPDAATSGTITRLESQVHNDDRVSVYLDGEFAFGIHEDLVVKHSLQVGAALDYLAYKPRTEEEVRRKLRQEDVPSPVIEDVIARLYELEYLDDEAYAHDYAHNRFSSKKYGPVRIRRELTERGVDRRLADAAVDELFAEVDVTAAAWTHAEKRWPRLAGEDDPRRRRQKMYRYLRRRGFTSNTIRPILDELEQDGTRNEDPLR
ncbi:MAG: recombinase RecX [Bacteroidetes bacterium QH_2_64_74]|nr:MAG: recombinase RecX [Bacteroidetes bacterium QH_2_64_74]